MKKKSIHALSYVVMILSLFTVSCNDFFDQTIDIQLPVHESVLAMTSRMSSVDTISTVYLSETKGTVDNSDLSVINNATVQIEVDGGAAVVLPYDDMKTFFAEGFYVGPALLNGSTNQEVIINVESDGYPSIRAIQKIPTKVLITESTFEPGEELNEEFTPNKMSLTFTDPIDEENFYAIRGFFEIKNGNDSYFDEFYVVVTDPLLSAESVDADNSPAFVFKDAAINGKKYTVKFENERIVFDGDPEISGRFIYQLVSLSKDAYLYELTLAAYQRSKDNPFAEPVVVYSNVEGGYGIFTIEVVDQVEHEF